MEKTNCNPSLHAVDKAVQLTDENAVFLSGSAMFKMPTRDFAAGLANQLRPCQICSKRLVTRSNDGGQT